MQTNEKIIESQYQYVVSLVVVREKMFSTDMQLLSGIVTAKSAEIAIEMAKSIFITARGKWKVVLHSAIRTDGDFIFEKALTA